MYAKIANPYGVPAPAPNHGPHIPDPGPGPGPGPGPDPGPGPGSPPPRPSGEGGYNAANYGGGGGGYQGLVRNLQGVQAPSTPYENQVLSGYWLDLANNPWAQDYAGAISQQYGETLDRDLSALASPFAGAGGTMGMTGINAATRGRAIDDSRQNLANSMAGFYGDLFQGERGRMQQTSGDISGRTQGLYAAGAQGYAADQQKSAQIQSARIQAQAQMQAAQMAQSLGYDQLAADMMFKAEQLNLQALQLERQAPLDYLSGVAPILDQFGNRNTQGTGNYIQSAGGGWPGFAQGAFGGALFGKGIYDAFSGGGS